MTSTHHTMSILATLGANVVCPPRATPVGSEEGLCAVFPAFEEPCARTIGASIEALAALMARDDFRDAFDRTAHQMSEEAASRFGYVCERLEAASSMSHVRRTLSWLVREASKRGAERETWLGLSTRLRPSDQKRQLDAVHTRWRVNAPVDVLAAFVH